MKHFLLLFGIFLALPAVLLSMPFQNRSGAWPVPPPLTPVNRLESPPFHLTLPGADTCPLCGMKDCPCHAQIMAAYKARSTVRFKLQNKASATDGKNKKVEEGAVCRLSHGKGDIHGICKMCGCRMRLTKTDLAKTCSYCKCGKKMKDCMFDQH